MPSVWTEVATGTTPVFPTVDEGSFNAITTKAVQAGALEGQAILKGGIERGRSQWARLSNWTMLLRLAQGRPSNSINYDRGDFFRAIQVQEGKTNQAEVGLMSPKGPHGQDMLAIANTMEAGATIRVTEKMRGWFASKGLHFRPSTTHIYIPPRPVFGLATDEMDQAVDRLVADKVMANLEALFR